MENLQDYKEINYSVFQKEMDLQFAKCEIKEIEMAIEIGLKSIATIKNCFRKDTQIVSDEVMTKVMNMIKLDGFILWSNGKRFYYIK